MNKLFKYMIYEMNKIINKPSNKVFFVFHEKEKILPTATYDMIISLTKCEIDYVEEKVNRQFRARFLQLSSRINYNKYYFS